MNQINEQRSFQRILAVCRVLDSKGNFLGFTLDLTVTGIQIIIQKDFPHQSPFEIILNQVKEDEIIGSNITIKVEQIWRSSTNEEFDQIGGKIIGVDFPDQLEKLVHYCDQKAKEKYQFDLEWQQTS
ncbi:PilZ domain-containing protein [Geminocystis sp. GBBB08]|uniref:PilZ domain-containing protein n=1 Tax=Geminocystis sp. GBBB08 TaxID=2604140 RepID=UPI0027E225AF|nr:PilZ domain-containing protein [Geminocystis sp. GBBB08]MBL1210433.1 PilZ domain-containing protein [Geminocystis sp. GBBB08]